MLASPPLIQDKSRMRKRACTDLCGGRSAMVVPTATVSSEPTVQKRVLGSASTLRLTTFSDAATQPGMLLPPIYGQDPTVAQPIQRLSGP